MRSLLRNVSLLVGLAALATVASATRDTHAATPLGLTQVSASGDTKAELTVIDGVAYVSDSAGVTPISSSGVGATITFSHPRFSEPFRTTRLVEATDGLLYAGINFGEAVDTGSGVGLFSLEDPTSPVGSWDDVIAFGFDAELVGFGGPAELGIRLRIGEDVDFLTVPWLSTVEISPSGRVYGNAGVPGTLGSAPAILNRDNTFEFLNDFGGMRSARDRLDRTGVNFAAALDSPFVVFYGDREPIIVDDPRQSALSPSFLVSESEFGVLRSRDTEPYRAYFPGINPAGSNLSVPLIDYFPLLSSVEFDQVTDITSADGRIHLLLSGNDGLWLFVAPDPTVIPEPTTFALALAALCSRALRTADHRRRSRRRRPRRLAS